MVKNSENKFERQQGHPLKDSSREKTPPDVIVQAVRKEFACSREPIITKGSKNNKTREVAIYLARDLSGFT